MIPCIIHLHKSFPNADLLLSPQYQHPSGNIEETSCPQRKLSEFTFYIAISTSILQHESLHASNANIIINSYTCFLKCEFIMHQHLSMSSYQHSDDIKANSHSHLPSYQLVFEIVSLARTK